jgi:hypothetical protein
MESEDKCHYKTKIMKYKVFLLCQKQHKKGWNNQIEKNSQEQTPKFNPKNMHVKRLLIYFKHNLSIVNYEQMVREAQ